MQVTEVLGAKRFWLIEIQNPFDVYLVRYDLKRSVGNEYTYSINNFFLQYSERNGEFKFKELLVNPYSNESIIIFDKSDKYLLQNFNADCVLSLEEGFDKLKKFVQHVSDDISGRIDKLEG